MAAVRTNHAVASVNARRESSHGNTTCARLDTSAAHGGPRYARRAAAARGGLSVHNGPRREKAHARPFHFQRIAHRGACGKPPIVPQNRRPGPEPADVGWLMRVLLSTPGHAGTSNRWWESRWAPCGGPTWSSVSRSG